MKNFMRIIAVMMCAVLLFAFAACNSANTTSTQTTAAPGTSDASSEKETTEAEITSDTTEATEAQSTEAEDPHKVENKTKFDTTKHVFVTFTVKGKGEFQVELYPEYAPNTVTNFVNLADSGYYNGTKFHRVVDGFMAQGGQNDKVETESIYGEFSSNGFEKNTLKHERGVISMARSNDPDSATGQFFICYDTADSLDGNYAAFGKITYGMDVIDSFLSVERSINSFGELAIPMEDIVIESAVVSQK